MSVLPPGNPLVDYIARCPDPLKSQVVGWITSLNKKIEDVERWEMVGKSRPPNYGNYWTPLSYLFRLTISFDADEEQKYENQFVCSAREIVGIMGGK